VSLRRAFVTGGTGFIGSAILRALLDEGTEVRALARKGTPRDNVEGLNLEIVEGDLADREALRRGLSGCTELYHCAALYAFWAKDPAEFLRSNVDGSRDIVRLAMDAGVSRIVYTSSVATVAPIPDGVATEDSWAKVEDAPGHYKRSKILAEQEVLRLAREENAPVIVVNPSAPIGPRDLKPTPTGKLLVDFVHRRMPAYVDTGLNLVDVDDCGRGHVLAARKGRVGERYILGGENLSLIEILRLLADLTGLKAPSIRLPHAVSIAAAAACEMLAKVTGREPLLPLEPTKLARKHMYFDAAKARDELGFASAPVRESLARALAWFEARDMIPRGSLLR
jgi:dihydroflavonol-4-reductase